MVGSALRALFCICYIGGIELGPNEGPILASYKLRPSLAAALGVEAYVPFGRVPCRVVVKSMVPFWDLSILGAV